MFPSLLPELLSINTDLPGTIAMAARHGFIGVDTQASALVATDLDTSRAVDALAAHGLRPGYISLPPGRVPASSSDWEAALKLLPQIGQRAQQIGYERAVLVVLPFHETLPYEAAFAEHVRRINTVTDILDDFNVALGLEYVSPLTRRAAYANHFIYDLRGALALCDALASPRAGVMLDSFHWHCAGETFDDIARLPAQRITVVHINDAPDRPNEEQSVADRSLPGATGVINLRSFVSALRATGYDGPVTCEPMAKAITALHAGSDEEVLALTARALNETLALTA